MKTTFSIDRFEGTKKETAVLLAEDGKQIDFPRSLLPPGSKAGDVVSFDIQLDRDAAERLKKETRQLQDKLRKTDSGEDIKL